MKKLLTKYLNKLDSQGLASKNNAIFMGLDDRLFVNRTDKKDISELRKLFELMSINSILFAEPSEPYRSIINEITRDDYPNRNSIETITPTDCETRTFLHDIPVVKNFSAQLLSEALSKSKSSILKDLGIVAYGTVTPEQAFVSYSSTCFACYVKYFVDAIYYFDTCLQKKKEPNERFLRSFIKIANHLKKTSPYEIFKDKFSISSAISKKPKTTGEVIKSITETGLVVVKLHLVDSYFGNISYVFGDNIYISQTGASLDDLESCIDKVPLNGSSSVGITSSSELPTHKRIYEETSHKAILHAHPRFSVIMSMFCPYKNCPSFNDRKICHTTCAEDRYVSELQIVPGEIGTGKTAILNTVPKAIKKTSGVIVYGHGVFTIGKEDFKEALMLMIDIEKKSYEMYFEKIDEYFSQYRTFLPGLI